MSNEHEEDLSNALPLPPTPDPEKLLKDIQAKASEGKTNAELGVDPRTAEEYTFTIDLTGGDGRRYVGEFTNRILTPQQRINAGVMRAALAQNTPFEALDPETSYLLEQIAHLTISIVKKPSWWATGGAKPVLNTDVLNAVYMEVAMHEATFRGSAPAPAASQDGGSNA
jgi:hypothetical protein